MPGSRLTALGMRLMLILVGPLCLASTDAHAQAAASKEYQIKAACLLNFIQFIEWPPAAFAEPASPLIVGVLGEDPFGDALEQTFQDEPMQGRPVVVKRSRQFDDLKNCHLLFIGRSEKEHLAEILKVTSAFSTLTVSETDGFAQSGGIINFYIDGGKIRFEINPDAAQRSGLKVGSQLLKRARIIPSEPKKGGQ